jgi:hypothetical protein
VQDLKQENDQLKARAETAELRADRADRETALIKAKLDLLIKIWCEREPNAEICR